MGSNMNRWPMKLKGHSTKQREPFSSLTFCSWTTSHNSTRRWRNGEICTMFQIEANESRLLSITLDYSRYGISLPEAPSRLPSLRCGGRSLFLLPLTGTTLHFPLHLNISSSSQEFAQLSGLLSVERKEEPSIDGH